MNVLGDLPTWAIVLLALLAAALLVALNIGWLLSAKAMLDAQRNKRSADFRVTGSESDHSKPATRNAAPTKSDGPPATPEGL